MVSAVQWLKEQLLKSVTVRTLVRDHYQRKGHVDWKGIMQGFDASEDGVGEPRILIATSVGAMIPAATMESVLALALRLRGARPSFLLCDGVLPACMGCHCHWHPGERYPKPLSASYCRTCFAPALNSLEHIGFPVLRYGDFLSNEEQTAVWDVVENVPVAEIAGLVVDGIHVGEHAMAGTLRFMARGDMSHDPAGEGVARQYLASALMTMKMARRLLRRHSFAKAVFHHGIYVPQGVLGEVCREAGVEVVNWNPSYRAKTFIFSHGDTYHKTMIEEPVEQWNDMPWSEARERKLEQYLYSKRGGQDWIWFHGRPHFDLDKVESLRKIDFSRPVTGLLTSVMWDAVLHYESNAFPGMLSWIVATVDYFSRHPQRQLVIRVHPAEVTGNIPSRQPVEAELRKVFPRLPDNVALIGPDESISTYALTDHCGQILIYNTKTGVEMAAMGKPVLVAGEAWIRGKGFSWDADSPEAYERLLTEMLDMDELDPAQHLLAKKYAYHYFFRRMLPINFFEPSNCIRQYTPVVESYDSFAPGMDAGLDRVCEGILDGTPFLMEEPDFRS